MIRDIRSSELVKNECFIREPVRVISNEIDKNKASKIILTGGRGTGKSVVLQNKEYKDLNSCDKSLYMRLISSLSFDENDELFDKKLITHFYEIQMSLNIINYIAKNYYMTFSKYFKDYFDEIRLLSTEMYQYINNVLYVENTNLENVLYTGDISFEIVRKMREVLEINDLTLMLDDFNKVNGGNTVGQRNLSNYFGMFDKVIITCDSEVDLLTNERLVQDDYSSIDVNYSNNPEVIRSILEKRIEIHNIGCVNSNEIELPLSRMTDDIYERLVVNCNGDIKLMLEVLREIINCYNWTLGKYDIGSDIEKLCDEGNKKIKKMNKMDANYPYQLHI